MARLFSRLIGWQPPEGFVEAHLSAPSFHRLRLDRFSRGIDNAHIDVSLSPAFISASMALVEVIVREDVQRYFWKQTLKTPDVEAVDIFRKQYTDLSSVVINDARALARPEHVQLYQLAVLKLLLALVDRQLLMLRKELDDSRAQPARQVSGQSLELHEKSVILVRHKEAIRFRAASDLLRVVMRIENSVLRKTRKTVLGTSWPICESMINNPFLQLGGVGVADDFIGFWPYLFYENNTGELSKAILTVLTKWLPDQVEVNGGVDAATLGKAPRIRRDQGGLLGYVDIEHRARCLIGEEELDGDTPHVLDDAESIARLLGGEGEDWPNVGPWKEPRFQRVQHTLVDALSRAFAKAGLSKSIEASYLLTDVYAELGIPGTADLVFDYMCGKLKRKELIRRYENNHTRDDAVQDVQRLDLLIKKHKPFGPHIQQRMIVRCVRDFMRYRYQLKMAYWTYRAMDDLRLLTNAKECGLSRANSLLQEFDIDGVGEDANRRVVGHVIIKADVRGSTNITDQMRAKNLNPAAYFSRNLYDPITALVDEFGAEKLFVEGDAVILMILQYESGNHARLAVARACGLSRKILQVVDAKNAESQRLSLPKLELGIGIAYADDEPTYLYDEGHKITISPAINRADRLSSCHSLLRKQLASQGRDRRGVEIVELISKGGGTSSGDLLRYNVNGIELEAPAYYQLGTELKLHSVSITDRRGQSSQRYQVGRYPDAKGNAHWLIVRDAVVQLWMGKEVVQNTHTEGGRYFHEVITDEKIISTLQRKVAGKAHKPS